MSDRIDEDESLLGEKGRGDLWESLGQMSQVEPNRRLRHRVFQAIDTQGSAGGWRAFLPRLPRQIVGFAAIAIAGIAIGLLVGRSGDDLDDRVARLEGNLITMNQKLLLSQLTAASATQRLSAAFQVSSTPQPDAEIARVLLQMAVRDPVDSVRSAAITAMGDNVNQANIASALLKLLVETESPIVQMAIVDLILRHGNEDAVRELRAHVETNQLHPSLNGYVSEATWEIQI